MQTYPPKLLKKIESLGEQEQDAKKKLFLDLLEKATTQGIQSPRFWAMRQVLADRSEREIHRKLNKAKLELQKKNKAKPTTNE